MPRQDAARPRFSIVSAVYNVSRYLDEFIASVDAQTFDLKQVEVIMVDDGSTDDSLARLQAWQQRRPGVVKVLTKPNGGQGSARNLGLEHATGEWVTFTDPDDTLDRKYLAEVAAFANEHPTVMLMATNRITFAHDTGEQSKHPLHTHFTKYNRLRDLDYDTGHFHGHASGAFFRLDILRRDQLSFDLRIRPTFEDGHFCCAYLLHVGRPMVGYLATAIYNYRKRGTARPRSTRAGPTPAASPPSPSTATWRLLRDGAGGTAAGSARGCRAWSSTSSPGT